MDIDSVNTTNDLLIMKMYNLVYKLYFPTVKTWLQKLPPPGPSGNVFKRVNRTQKRLILIM